MISGKTSDLKNNTKMDILLYTYKEESLNYVYDYKIRLRIKLPNTQNKLKFFIYDDAEYKKDKLDNENKKEQNIGFVYKIKKTTRKSLKLYLALKYKKGIIPYTKLKFKYYYNFKNNIIMNFAEHFIYSSDDKFETISKIEFSKKLSKTFKLINTNSYFWSQQKDEDILRHSLKLYQNIKNTSDYFGYEITQEKNNKKDTLFTTKNYQVIFQYRHYIKKWIYYEVVPKIIYYENKDFSAVHQLRFNLSINFGK